MLQSWNISSEAIKFIESLAQEQAPGTHLLIEVNQGGTPHAQLSLTFEQVNRLNQRDNVTVCSLSSELSCYTDTHTLSYLEKLQIDFKEGLFGGELEIHAPCLYGTKTNLSLLEQIQMFFAQELLPYLKQHKGYAVLEEVTADNFLVLKFEGGCQGCSMAKVTLKQGIEQKIKERFPQIQGIIDMTNHSEGNQPFA
jgi:Fe/S biogenesis protein NfuA